MQFLSSSTGVNILAVGLEIDGLLLSLLYQEI